jgi:hypothetical protein
MTCLPYKSHGGVSREEKMSLIPMIVWKLIEILQKSPKVWSRLGKWLKVSIEFDHPSLDRSPLETDLLMEEKKNTVNFFSQGEVGFHNIMKVHWKSTSRFSSFFSPPPAPACRQTG